MRKIVICIALAFVLVMGVSSTGMSGLYVDDDVYCNDHYFGFDNLGGGIYQLHGWEYGCGNLDVLRYGTMHVTGGYAYIGASGVDGSNGDYGALVTDYWVVYLGTSPWAGNGVWNYFYCSGGSPAVFGGTSTVIMRTGGPPALGTKGAAPNRAPE